MRGLATEDWEDGYGLAWRMLLEDERADLQVWLGDHDQWRSPDSRAGGMQALQDWDRMDWQVRSAGRRDTRYTLGTRAVA